MRILEPPPAAAAAQRLGVGRGGLGGAAAARHGGLEHAEGRARPTVGGVGAPSADGRAGAEAAPAARGCRAAGGRGRLARHRAEAARLELVLVGVAALRAAAARAVKVVQRGGDGLRLGILQLVDLDAARAGVAAVEPRHPFAHEVDPAARAGHGQHGVGAGHRLELDGALRHATLAGVDDVVELRDDRVGRGIGHREDGDRFGAHPVDVDRRGGFDGGAALGGRAGDDDEVGAGVGLDRARAAAEAFQQLAEIGGRHVARRDDGGAVSLAHVAARDGADAARVGGGHDAVQVLVLHHGGAERGQRRLEQRHQPGPGDRLGRGERDLAGDALVDEVIGVEDVAEDRLGDRADVGAFEIELIAVAGRGHPVDRRHGLAGRRRIGLARRRDGGKGGAGSRGRAAVDFGRLPGRTREIAEATLGDRAARGEIRMGHVVRCAEVRRQGPVAPRERQAP